MRAIGEGAALAGIADNQGFTLAVVHLVGLDHLALAADQARDGWRLGFADAVRPEPSCLVCHAQHAGHFLMSGTDACWGGVWCDAKAHRTLRRVRCWRG